MKRKWGVVFISIIILAIFIPIFIYNWNTPNADSQSSDEEICKAIRNDKLRNGCLDYLKNGLSSSQCWYAKDFCDNNYSKMSEEERREVYNEIAGSLTSTSVELFYGSFNLTENVSISNVHEVCGLNKQDCYGSCNVGRAACVNRVATITGDPEVCKFAEVPPYSKDVCLRKLAFLNGDIELCNMMDLHRLEIDKCYLDIVAENIHFISERHPSR